eukprot:scaffold4102_cov168-Amphora_coffeaeformis.AAC.5
MSFAFASRMLPPVAVLLSALIAFIATAGVALPLVRRPTALSANEPLVANTAPSTTSQVDPLQDHVSAIVQTYRDTVSDYVQQQTQSWNSHFTALAKDDRSEDELRHARGELYRDPPTYYKKLRDEIQAASQRDDNAADHFNRADITWDREEDIILYLEGIGNNCERNAMETESFDRDCWDALHDLVVNPRCTTRLDSRYRCTGEESKQVISGEELLQKEFQPDTINIVIIGAGPVGLFLANALSTISVLTFGKRKIRVVMFENRIHENGFKNAYSRNWISELHTEYMQSLDPMLKRLFEIIHWPGFYRIPIHTTETLFLLSNRYRGIKFLYDDLQNYMDVLKEAPNLVVFDATGHRMVSLDREGKTRDIPPTIQPWSFHPYHSFKEFFDEAWYQTLLETESLVHVGEQETAAGRILFPVSARGRPYHAHMLKINDVRTSPDKWETLDLMQEDFLSGESPLCRSQHSSPCILDDLTHQIPSETEDPPEDEEVHSSNVQRGLHNSEDGRADKDTPNEERHLDQAESNQEGWDEDEGANGGGQEWDETASGRNEWEDEEGANWDEEEWDAAELDRIHREEEEAYPYQEESSGAYDRKVCMEWCGRLFVYDSPGMYRDDINQWMQSQGPKHLGQTLVLSSIHGEQADVFWYLLGGDDVEKLPRELKLKNLPVSGMAALDVFRPNGFDKILSFFANTEFEGMADVTLFQYRPYLYKDPLVPGGFFGNDETPLLRLGDSLASGDPNMGTGLNFHIQVVQDLVSRMAQDVIPELSASQ